MANYAQIRSMDISNGFGIGVSLFFSGCDFHCKNCFNSELWNHNYGKPFTDNEINTIIHLMNNSYISRLSILGGDGLMDYNLSATIHLVEEVKKKYPEKKIWLYTGYTWEDIWEDSKIIIDDYTYKIYEEYKKRQKIISKCNVLVDGQYVDSQKDITLKWRGSTNQRIIDIQKSIEQNKVVLYCE